MYYIPYNYILTPLLKQQSLLHYVLNYVVSITKDRQYIETIKKRIQQISELVDNNETNIASSRIIKLIQTLNFDINEFESIMLLQI